MRKLIEALRNAHSRPVQGALRRGYEDAAKGITECPYPDNRNKRNRVTWSRALRNAWKQGQDLWKEENA